MKPIFVYVDKKLDSGEPFYIGKGNQTRVNSFKRNKVWHRIALKHGIIREVVLGTYDNAFALEEEIRLIDEFKTHVRHAGANLTDGGEGTLGWDPTSNTRQRMRNAKLGRKFSDSHRNSMSLAHVKRFQKPTERTQIHEVWKKIWVDHREIMIAARTGENNGRAVLTEQNVRDIRTAWDAYDASLHGATKKFCVVFAQRFGLTSENVYGIVKRKFWKHVI